MTSLTENLSIYAHFNGDLINKYCRNNYQITSYATPANNLFRQEENSKNAVVWVMDFGLLYTASFTQNQVTISENFQNVLNGYYEHIKSLASMTDRVLVVGLETDITSVSYFDNYLNNGYVNQIVSFIVKVSSFLNNHHKGLCLSYKGSPTKKIDYKMSATLGCTYDPGLFKLVGSAIDSFSSAVRCSFKAVIFDLDNTLWKGVIGEGFQNTSLGNPSLDDSDYSLLRNYIRLAYETGVFTAICSKNDIDTLTSELDKSNHGYLLDYFTIIKVNWKDKSKNISDIAQELNIGLESCVFVDDNPRELSNIVSKHPQVSIVDASNGPWDVLDYLTKSQYFKRYFLLEDDIRRNKAITERMRGALYKQKSSDTSEFEHDSEFYESDISFQSVQKRVEQLSLKTNQFNLSTRRLTWRNIDNLIVS